MRVERADHLEVIEALKQALADTTPVERAALVEGCVQAVYDHVKFDSPEGGGLDGRAGPERSGLADIVDAAKAYSDDLNIDGLPDNTQ